MITSIKNSLLTLIALSTIIACEKTDEIGPNDKGTFSIEFDNRVGLDELKLNATKAKTPAGEEYTVSRLNYFVSNIKLTKANGQEIAFSDKYFLVRETDDASQTISLQDVPAGDYIELSYVLGVDSLMSIADVGARKGVLDPASYGDDNMYWSWNMGYIFFKIEGNASVVTQNPENKFEYHIGGFGGKDAVTPNNIKEITIPLSTNAMVRQNKESTVHILFDINKVFEGEKSISLTNYPSIHSPKVALDVSKNYVKGFSLDHVHN